MYLLLITGASLHELIVQVKINNKCIAFCHLIIFYKAVLNSGTHVLHLLLDLQYLGSFGKDPAVDSAVTHTTRFK